MISKTGSGSTRAGSNSRPARAHLPLQRLQAIDLTFHRPIARALFHRRLHRAEVLLDQSDKPFQRMDSSFSGFLHPAMQRFHFAFAQNAAKPEGQLAQQIELSSDLKTLTMTVHTVGRSEPNIVVFERQ